ncbi:flagellar hook protein FlgE [Paremcibacter congregatus]|uniref:Flagellar hook protein FlgE n=1 Tax=Paremcibacter congregatus TaxID=2043170 RepID=A0A2G4YSI6_9PROT|nr:flagellar hook protein FlgE [Paremcibacter congregatus]PHZ85263.1 flagellar biosynthesis protein FlgE [Paremcibacter congregatus]QDE27805.1 flagellar hook protein FlgE [Paremcibacter congregatus]
MSLYASLFSGVSGLGAYSSALGMISDNIANLNTVGYKETRASFSTLVTESRSSTSYSPGGVQALPQNLISRQGLLQSSTSATDLSIDGAGFFVVSTRGESVNANSEISFTRAGSFNPDSEGFLKNTAGLYLMGVPLISGTVKPESPQLADLQPINVSDLTSTAEASTNVTLRANLQSSQAINAAMGTYDPSVKATSMSGYAEDVAAGVAVPVGIKPDFQTNIEVFDARGGVHTVTVAALRSADNVWEVEMYVDPPTDIVPTVGTTGQIAAGTVTFNGDGTLNVPGTTASLLAAVNVPWSGGANAGSLTFDLGTNGLSDGLTQFAGESTIISSSANGATFGNVIGVNIDKDGIVSALFSNGLAKNVYQLPISTFQNPDGLTRRQGNSYTVSDQSGSSILKYAGVGGAGFVAPQTLEASTVDLAGEFTNLITIQRAFSASTKIITTADEMLTELNNIKR